METSTAGHDWLLEEVAGLFGMKKDRSAACEAYVDGKILRLHKLHEGLQGL